MRKDVRTVFFFGANIGRHVGNDYFLAQVVLNDLWHIGIDGFVVSDTGARRIRQCHAAFLVNVHETGNTQQ